jgi:hypothetical protein
MARLAEINQQNRARQQRALAGPAIGPADFTSHSPTPASATGGAPILKFHEAMMRFNRELMEWNRLNQMGKARGIPPSAPRPGVDFYY